MSVATPLTFAYGHRGLCDGDLMELGIVSTSIARKRQRDGKGDGIFQAEKLREMLIKLVCGAASAKPPSRENRQIFSEFQPIEGNSQVLIRESLDRRGGTSKRLDCW